MLKKLATVLLVTSLVAAATVAHSMGSGSGGGGGVVRVLLAEVLAVPPAEPAPLVVELVAPLVLVEELVTERCAIINFEQKLWACQPTLKFKMLSRRYQATWPRPLAHTRWGDVPFRDCPTFFRSLPHLHLRFLRATADYNRFFAKDLQATNLVVA